MRVESAEHWVLEYDVVEAYTETLAGAMSGTRSVSSSSASVGRDQGKLGRSENGSFGYLHRLH